MNQRKITGILFIISPLIVWIGGSILQWFLYKLTGNIGGGMISMSFFTIISVFFLIPSGIYLVLTKGEKRHSQEIQE